VKCIKWIQFKCGQISKEPLIAIISAFIFRNANERETTILDILIFHLWAKLELKSELNTKVDKFRVEMW